MTVYSDVLTLTIPGLSNQTLADNITFYFRNKKVSTTFPRVEVQLNPKLLMPTPNSEYFASFFLMISFTVA